MIRKKQKLMKKLNTEIKNCTACQLSSTRNHVLIGEGDIHSRVMLIALSPGKKEDEEDRMFVGPSGKVLNKLFDTVGIKRESFYMTNLIKCMLPKNRRPKMDEIESCSRFLDEEISIIDPDVMIPLGFYVTRYILNKFQADIPDARKDFARLYGKLFFSENKKILPLPHPASLLYNPSFESETREKYKTLKTLLHECKWYPSCPMKRFCQQGRLEKKWIELYCKGDWKSCIRYKMEEKGELHPDFMLPDGSLDKRLK
jgi:uracil-DNA glycosylase family 4